MKFLYKAKDVTGKIVSDTMVAEDKLSLARELRNKGETLIYATEQKNEGGGLLVALNRFVGKVKPQERIVFARNLGAMISAGIALSRGISILKKQTGNFVFKEILGELESTLAGGGTLSDGMKRYPKVFSSLFVSMVRVGEETGGLTKILKEVASNLEKTYGLTQKVKGALIYPGIVLTAIIVVGVLMFIYVIPTLTETFKEANIALPASTRLIISVSDLFAGHPVIVLSVLASFFIGGFLFLKTKAGHLTTDYVSLKMPIIGTITREINAARTARTLSSLFTSGVSINQSLSITKDVLQNHYFKDVIASASVGVEKGQPLSKYFQDNTKLYPVIVGEMMEVGEETGKMGEMLLNIAEFYEEEVDRKTKNMSTIVEPFLMLLVGSAVGFFAIAMLSPTYSLINVI